MTKKNTHILATTTLVAGSVEMAVVWHLAQRRPLGNPMVVVLVAFFADNNKNNYAWWPICGALLRYIDGIHSISGQFIWIGKGCVRVCILRWPPDMTTHLSCCSALRRRMPPRWWRWPPEYRGPRWEEAAPLCCHHHTASSVGIWTDGLWLAGLAGLKEEAVTTITYLLVCYCGCASDWVLIIINVMYMQWIINRAEWIYIAIDRSPSLSSLYRLFQSLSSLSHFTSRSIVSFALNIIKWMQHAIISTHTAK